jgi:hypothetical protein
MILYTRIGMRHKVLTLLMRVVLKNTLSNNPSCLTNRRSQATIITTVGFHNVVNSLLEWIKTFKIMKYCMEVTSRV